ncbi:MAG: nitroreductase family protein, partial [Oscillospiraceae bacterium]|nr:nitroreductase family protein [Oscillospiraceae bacterium]
MNLSEFEKLVRQNRSYRGYDEGRRVSKEELLQMVNCARLSASSVNMQPLKYYLAWEEETVKKLQPLTGWAKNLPDLSLPHPGM